MRGPIGQRLLLEFACWDGVRVGWGVSEVLAAFVTSLAGMWRNHDDRALRLNGTGRRIELKRSPNGYAPTVGEHRVCANNSQFGGMPGMREAVFMYPRELRNTDHNLPLLRIRFEIFVGVHGLRKRKYLGDLWMEPSIRQSVVDILLRRWQLPRIARDL